MKVIVFDIWGDYGHFKVPYTTSSPLTFPIPPKTALYGMIAAILGYDKNEYLKYFLQTQWNFGVKIIKPIQTIYIPENFIDTKRAKLFNRMQKNKPCRTQMNLEFLKNPSYRIYVTSNDENELTRLEQLLIEHKTTYTLTLGLSECLANFKYIGTYNLKKVENNENKISISSIIPISVINSNQINWLNDEYKFFKIHIPLEMNGKRELLKSENFLIEINGKKILAKLPFYYNIEEINENIIIF